MKRLADTIAVALALAAATGFTAFVIIGLIHLVKFVIGWLQ